MILPFESLSDERRALGLAFAVFAGMAFGFVLERVGFGRAQKLAGQFYGSDLTVFKVMFSAIVTAMLGIVILSGVGVADLSALNAGYTTYLWPMIVGGVLLGVGFIVAGYCPGTSLVAAASGKLDGLVTVAGLIVGSLLYSELQPYLRGFHDAGRRGSFHLYDWLHVPHAVLAAAITAIALGAFVAAERIERIVNGGRTAAPGRTRSAVFLGFVALALAGLATLAIPVVGSAAR
jgi:uncharacterized protein